MICQFKISEFGDFGLKLLDRLILEFLDFATMHADQMVMVITPVQFEYGISTFKVMTHDQARGLKLGEDTVNRGKTDFFAFTDQGLEDTLGAQMLSVVGSFQDFENLDAGQGDF
jgi:hypothetical protein